MESKEIRRYAKLMAELDLVSLEVSENGATLKLVKNPVAANVQPAVQTVPVVAEPKAETVVQAPVTKEVNIDDANVHTVSSPMVGTFYRAPAEDAKPYVNVGDKVKKGDIICIIEAMKLMNEIVAEVSGVITEVCADDKQFVDYGTPLFKIRRG